MVDPKYETSPSNQTCDAVDTSASTFFMVVYSLLFVVGLPLNGFVIKFYCCQAQQQASSSLKVFLKNLTAADFLLCLSLPLRIGHYNSGSIIIWQLYCSFGASAFYLNMCASIIFMGYIAANRYLKIVHPSRTRVLQTVRTARIISMITWTFLVTTGIIFIILFFITHKSLPSSISRCVLIFSPLVTVSFKIIQALCVVTFLVVFISLVFFYYSTSRRVLQAQQRQLASSGSEKLLKSRRNMLVLVSIFCVCFVPFYLVRLPSVFLWSSCSVGPVLYYLQEVTTMVATFNVCLDPLVYFFLCKTFHAQVRMAFRGTNIQQANEESE
ncbi:P2Y purinoceptor 14-like [Astatotilapia calliptera]|uniref:G-protein coupled receptors family 1 profile domain-containing protein n=1 Tax=Astatotilapia calliptera TaxID=8154 RepID=A0A3P8P711_ASTCA|nr:P2Y purinoceptor 14-like [Astatotilapia calliptera]